MGVLEGICNEKLPDPRPGDPLLGEKCSKAEKDANGKCKGFLIKGSREPFFACGICEEKAEEPKRRLRVARRAAAILAAILLLVAIICKIMAAEEPVEESVGEIQQETEAKELPHKATEPERVWQEPIEETRSGSDNSHNEYLLARLAMAEAEGESIEGKAMVIRVVLNREQSSDFPDTIEGVIFEKGQFTPVENGRFERVEPNAECWAALDMVLIDGWDESEGALYFEAVYNGENTWHSENLEYIKTVGNHNFYR